MSQEPKSLSGRTYWRSLDQLADRDDFRRWLHREFPENAEELSAPSRRSMLKLMAASFGLAGLTACRRPVEHIMPFSRGVEDIIPGKAVYYATSTTRGGVSTGLLVESNDGRPTKIEGNPKHPSSLGAASAFDQATVLGLYDPDRSKAVMHDGGPSNWDEFEAFTRSHFGSQGDGAGLWFLSETTQSPTMQGLRDEALRTFPKARWVEYEPLVSGEPTAGARVAFGRPAAVRHHFDKADVIVSLDCDFLGQDSETTIPVREFSRRRRVASETDSMNRLYVAEAQYTMTGAMADHRLRVRVGDTTALAVALARELKLLPAELKILNNAVSKQDKWVAAVARDLERHGGRSLVVASPRQPAAVHALVYWINEALDNVGRTVSYTDPVGDVGGPRGIAELTKTMAAGDVETLVMLGGNPAYDAPADLKFAERLDKVPVSIHLGSDVNETAALATWHLPRAHDLEAWGDGRAHDGTITFQQPLIAPLYGGRSAIEVLAVVSGHKDRRGYDLVRNHWLATWGGPAGGNSAEQAETAEATEKDWRRCLHDGLLADSARPVIKVLVDPAAVKQAVSTLEPSEPDRLEVAFYADSCVWDGRFANNGWLQEAPDPMTKLTWDNAALVSPATAESLVLETGDVIAIELAGAEAEMPVWVQPGHADHAISLALGYGRRRVGRVGDGVGHNAYPIRTSAGMGFCSGASICKTGRRHVFASTQEHHSMEDRPLVREATLGEYGRHPEFAKEAVEHPPLLSLYDEHSYDEGYQWGMSIDLNSYIGCNGCLVACQSENNIPVVGKQEVLNGREMHWIRLDRYYTGDPEEPEAVSQPVNCQQCENAPCENVCPVQATVHSPEGLNDMTYNRCVGTRYCANNCPYKVRRFNYLDFHEGIEESQQMAFNPNVTVRVRGVMEKCTYCVQRIQEKKIAARAEGREVADGEIKTACQQTCPAEAIVFGNINDPESRVSKLKHQNRDYAMLGELNTKPRTTFLAKLRNPNPELT